MKNILFVGMSPNKGGIETFMMNVFSKLNNHGFHFEFINNFDKPIAYSNQIRNDGGIIRNVYINPTILGHLNRYKIAYNFFIKHHDYDIVHVNAVSINMIFWIKAAQKFNIKKLIIHSHNNNVKNKSKIINLLTKILSIKNRYYLNSHDNIIELSASKDAGRWMFHNNRFKVIKNGIKTNLFLHNYNLRLKFRNKLNISMKDNVVIAIARMEKQKNYFRIIRIFNHINHSLPNTKLVIVGNGTEKINIYNFVNKLGLNKKVIFLGIINNVNEILNIADLMLLPSKYEAFPYSLVEAQASGIPALVSSESVPKESNITNKLEYISLNKNDKYWSDKAIAILNTPYNIKERQEMNQIVAKSKYNINYLINQMKKIYLLNFNNM